MTYRERRERRAERLRGWADTRDQRAAATLESLRPYTDDYAFNTQPGHIPARARVIAAEDRAFASMQKADSMRSRADGIEAQMAAAIYSDDPDVVEALEQRLATLEAERNRIKAYNATCRRGQPDESLLTESDLAGLRSHQRFYGAGNGSMPSYALSNLSGNIKRNRDRLAALRGA